DGEEEKDESSDSNDKREGTEDKGPSAEGEGLRLGEDEAAPEGQDSGSVPEPERDERVYAFRQPTLVTWVDPEDGRAYIDIPAYAPPDHLFRHRRIMSGRLVEMQWGLIHDHTEHLGELSPALFERYDRDVRELFTRSWEVRENHELRLQLVEEGRERLELADRVARLERKQESEGE
ncbi:hypothetical protein Tco_1550915, partial [Tanacetum coccineum]